MKATDALPFPPVILVIVGASGVEAGVADMVFDATLLPFSFIAFICMLHAVPFTKLESNRGVATDIGSRIVHFEPPSVEYL